VTETEQSKADPREHPIIFFDGVCNLCNFAVDLVMRHDPKQHFRFAPLQGETARALLPEGTGISNSEDGEAGWSMVFLDGKGIHERSAAALRVGIKLGGFIGVASRISLFMPRFLADFLYRWVARHRYRIFGRKETCRIPSANEQALFLP
jgi:predicted DCC family thiol-disulfide oxidoreductase YuxK